MNNVEKFFDKLNNEMAYLDPYKWLLDIDVEDITKTIEELEEDISNLENQIKEYDGSLVLFSQFVKRCQESIKYKRECIDILYGIQEEANDDE